MGKRRNWSAYWICDPRYAARAPIPVFQKELASADAATDHREDLKNQHVYFRKTFETDDIAPSAHIYISADDYYKLYINGQYVGQGPAQGYYFRYAYNQYDIRRFLSQGTNVIAVHVYYNGTINRVYNSGDYRQGFIAEGVMDGQVLFRSDASWRCKASLEYGKGETTGYHTQFLEHVDSRYSDSWREAGYEDSTWLQAAEKPADDHLLFLQETPVLDVYTIKPKAVDQLTDSRYVIDFGHELTGQFQMAAQGKPGRVITIRCGEELAEDETHVRFQMRCSCTYEEHWTLSGKLDKLEFFDYKGFRYVEVIGDPDIFIDPDNFSAVVRHYPLDEQSCTFISSDEKLNRIWEICKQGVKYGSQEQFLDCPTREKGQYLGDNTIITHAHMYISGDMRLTKKALRDFALSAEAVCPGLLAVAPGSFMQEIADFSLQWPLQLLQYYRQSGDHLFLSQMLPIAEGILRYFKRYEREDGLIEQVTEKWNVVDWPDNLRDGYDFDLTIPIGEGCHIVINAFYIGAWDALAEIQSILGSDGGSEEEYIRRKQAFQRVFYCTQTRLYVDAEDSKHSSLHANALPLYFALAPEAGIPSIVEFLKAKRLSCGVYMAYFLLKGLARAGQYPLVFELLTCDDRHSWSNMIREGATTCFEAWGKEQKWNTSLCHPWASSPIPVLIEEIIGLKPLKPGWETIRFDPHIPDQLKDFHFKMKVKTGTIEVRLAGGMLEIHAPKAVKVKRR